MDKLKIEKSLNLLKSADIDKSETIINPNTKFTDITNKLNLTKPKKRNFKEMSATIISDEIKKENSAYINTLQSRKKKLTNPNQSNRILIARKNLNASSNKISSSACERDPNKESITVKSAKNLKTSRQGQESINNFKARTTVRNISTNKRKDYLSVDEGKFQNSEFLLTEINEEENKPKPKKKV